MNGIKVFAVDSLLSETNHISSTNFVYELPERLNGIISIELISGSIPETLEPFLYLDIENLRVKNIVGPRNRTYFAIIRYRLPAVAEQNLIDLETHNCIATGQIGTMTELRIKLYDRLGNLYNFGADRLILASMSNASPTVITTTVNHGLANGDIVYLRNVPNLSTFSLKQQVEETAWTVTVTGGTTFTIPFDLSGEAVNQQTTGTLVAYPLGQNAVVDHPGDISYAIVSIVAFGSETRIETDKAHNITVGKLIKIYGMDNGATRTDNSKINSQHIVTTVSDNTHFDIPVSLSSYVTPSQVTGTEVAYTLGIRSDLYIAKYQCSFDFAIQASNKM